MSSLLDLFETGETFATTNSIAPLGKQPNIRLWRINGDGTPVEITKENNQ